MSIRKVHRCESVGGGMSFTSFRCALEAGHAGDHVAIKPTGIEYVDGEPQSIRDKIDKPKTSAELRAEIEDDTETVPVPPLTADLIEFGLRWYRMALAHAKADARVFKMPFPVVPLTDLEALDDIAAKAEPAPPGTTERWPR